MYANCDISNFDFYSQYFVFSPLSFRNFLYCLNFFLLKQLGTNFCLKPLYISECETKGEALRRG